MVGFDDSSTSYGGLTVGMGTSDVGKHFTEQEIVRLLMAVYDQLLEPAGGEHSPTAARYLVGDGTTRANSGTAADVELACAQRATAVSRGPRFAA